MNRLIFLTLVLFLSFSPSEGKDRELFEGTQDGVRYRFYKIPTAKLVSIQFQSVQDTFTKENPVLNPAIASLFYRFWGAETKEKDQQAIIDEMINTQMISCELGFIKVTPENLLKALEFNQELSSNIKCVKEKFETYKDSLFQETQANEAQTREKFEKFSRESLYSNVKDHPNYIFTSENVLKVKFEDLEILRKKNYPKESYIITGCGNLTELELKKVITFITQDMPKCEKGTNFEDFKTSGKVFDEKVCIPGLSQSEVSLIYPLTQKIQKNTKDSKCLQIINTAVMLGGTDSLLLSKMRGKNGLYSADFSFIFGEYTTELQGNFQCSPEDVDKYTQSYKDTLTDIRKTGLSQELFEQAKGVIIVNAEFESTSIDSITRRLFYSVKDGLTLEESLNAKKLFEGITLEDVNEALLKYMQVDKLSRFVTYPE